MSEEFNWCTEKVREGIQYRKRGKLSGVESHLVIVDIIFAALHAPNPQIPSLSFSVSARRSWSLIGAAVVS